MTLFISAVSNWEFFSLNYFGYLQQQQALKWLIYLWDCKIFYLQVCL